MEGYKSQQRTPFSSRRQSNPVTGTIRQLKIAVKRPLKDPVNAASRPASNLRPTPPRPVAKRDLRIPKGRAIAQLQPPIGGIAFPKMSHEWDHLFSTVLTRKPPSSLNSTKAVLPPVQTIAKNKVKHVAQASENFQNSPYKPTYMHRQDIPASVKFAIRSTIGLRTNPRPIPAIDIEPDSAQESQIKKSTNNALKAENSSSKCMADLFSVRRASHQCSPGHESSKFARQNHPSPSRAKEIIVSSPSVGKEQTSTSQKNTVGSNAEVSTNSGSFVKFNDAISMEREKLIQFNRICNILCFEIGFEIKQYRLQEERKNSRNHNRLLQDSERSRKRRVR